MALQKPEWFKMDPAKFLCDAKVDAMSTLELGACVRLLCRQWLDGFIPDDQQLLARLCRLDAAAMGEAWVTLSSFFPPIEAGKRANRFMWVERQKVAADLEKRSDEGTKAARKRWDDVRGKRSASPIGSVMPHPIQEQIRAEQTRGEENAGLPMPRPSSSEKNINSGQGVTEESFTLDDAVTYVLVETGLAGKPIREVIHQVIARDIKKLGAEPTTTAETMIRAWQRYDVLDIQFKLRPENFFGGGTWRKPEKEWRARDGAQGPQNVDDGYVPESQKRRLELEERRAAGL
jgi:uncharacterized protein YdaU (DUF1376 family)